MKSILQDIIQLLKNINNRLEDVESTNYYYERMKEEIKDVETEIGNLNYTEQ